MIVVTGFSSKSEGFLVISEKPLAEVAECLDLVYMEIEFMSSTYDIFTRPQFTEEDVLEAFRTYGVGDLGRGIWEVFSQDVTLDRNLTGVAHW